VFLGIVVPLLSGLGGGCPLRFVFKPNKSVKATRRPLAVLKFGFHQGSAASLSFL
jgi:hypothetical protein